MTNAAYILSKMTDYDLSMLFTGTYNYSQSMSEGFGKKIFHAFTKWRDSGDRPMKNYFCSRDQEKDRPSVFAYSRVRKDGVWGNFSYRTIGVAFQVWLSMQYNPEDWR